MKQQQTNKKSGFTIIEVVLVLAIAALIFLLVFLAFPALQRNQRDTQRRNDMGRLVSQVSQYQTNNGGELPISGSTIKTSFITGYLKKNSKFADPVHGDYQFEIDASGTATPGNGKIKFTPGKTCKGEDATGAGGSRSVAFRINLESGGAYCQAN